MQAFASLIFAVVPILLYLWGIWLMDRYDREPFGLLVLNFGWGALGAIVFVLFISSALSTALGADDFQQRVVIAPLIEETAKGLFLLWTARDRRFDNITDGVVYGMAIGLGFGMTENFLYFLNASSAGDWAQRVMLRTLYTAVMHAMATASFGAFIGMTKFGLPRLRLPLRIAGLLSAMAMHAAWNFWTMVDATGSGVIDALFIGLSLAVILVIMQVSLFIENRLILRELGEEAREGRLPVVHLEYLPYSSRRRMLGWLSPNIDRRQYVQLATRLAFRKSQCRSVREERREQYREEIDAIRNDIAQLLARDAESPAARYY